MFCSSYAKVIRNEQLNPLRVAAPFLFPSLTQRRSQWQISPVAAGRQKSLLVLHWARKKGGVDVWVRLDRACSPGQGGRVLAGPRRSRSPCRRLFRPRRCQSDARTVVMSMGAIFVVPSVVRPAQCSSNCEALTLCSAKTPPPPPPPEE